MNKDKEVLKEYIPEPAVDEALILLKKHHIFLKITRARQSKLGDFKFPKKGELNRITVNQNLNPYSFLITLVHEIAHVITFEKHQSKAKPHGKEWKENYRNLLLKMLALKCFPEELSAIIRQHAQKAPASTMRDLDLSRALHNYDENNDSTVRLENLEKGKVFISLQGIKYKKGDKKRTRFLCKNLSNARNYSFHPLTPVVPV